ncbi:unnamed protein product [Cyprideis torosa]|uniref:Chitin-binding type-4 domain-containing protein n=1 Tax=Cyprideis torosa TaxID=163714 RepID=A0A7R8ZPM7_9CRUS|nr:unnamed protein product [Cyprideis torosa]CAG0888711.1 unnamed protein product [Cyprideis torosa]
MRNVELTRNQLFPMPLRRNLNENSAATTRASVPRPNEAGGTYANGIIVRKYRKNSSIKIVIELTANHRGFFEFRLCPNNNVKKLATQRCLDKYLLRRTDGIGARFYPGEGNKTFLVRYNLPKDVLCNQCVLQWRYVAGNNWGRCPNGTEAVGCGHQEEFRSCADVAIVGRGRITTFDEDTSEEEEEGVITNEIGGRDAEGNSSGQEEGLVDYPLIAPSDSDLVGRWKSGSHAPVHCCSERLGECLRVLVPESPIPPEQAKGETEGGLDREEWERRLREEASVMGQVIAILSALLLTSMILFCIMWYYVRGKPLIRDRFSSKSAPSKFGRSYSAASPSFLSTTKKKFLALFHPAWREKKSPLKSNPLTNGKATSPSGPLPQNPSAYRRPPSVPPPPPPTAPPLEAPSPSPTSIYAARPSLPPPPPPVAPPRVPRSTRSMSPTAPPEIYSGVTVNGVALPSHTGPDLGPSLGLSTDV